MTVKRFAFIVMFLAGFCHPKIIPIIREGFELCAEPENRAGKLDYSNLEIIAESDEDVFLNGSILFLKEIKAPWKALFFLEKFHRDKWNMEMIKKSVPDFCATIQKPSEPWYFITSKFEHKDCPFPAGVRKFVLIPLSLMQNHFSFLYRMSSTSTCNL